MSAAYPKSRLPGPVTTAFFLEQDALEQDPDATLRQVLSDSTTLVQHPVLEWAFREACRGI